MGTGKLLGNLTSCGEVTCNGLASRPGRVELLLTASLHFYMYWLCTEITKQYLNNHICQHCGVKTSMVTPSFYSIFNISLSCENACQVSSDIYGGFFYLGIYLADLSFEYILVFQRNGKQPYSFPVLSRFRNGLCETLCDFITIKSVTHLKIDYLTYSPQYHLMKFCANLMNQNLGYNI